VLSARTGKRLDGIEANSLVRGHGKRNTLKGCAVVRTDGIATGSGRRSRPMTSRRTTNLDSKERGDKSMLVKREVSEDV